MQTKSNDPLHLFNSASQSLLPPELNSTTNPIFSLVSQTGLFVSFVHCLQVEKDSSSSPDLSCATLWRGKIETYLAHLKQQWHHNNVNFNQTKLDRWSIFECAVDQFIPLLLSVFEHTWHQYSKKHTKAIIHSCDDVMKLYQDWLKYFDKIYRAQLLSSEYSRCYGYLINAYVELLPVSSKQQPVH